MWSGVDKDCHGYPDKVSISNECLDILLWPLLIMCLDLSQLHCMCQPYNENACACTCFIPTVHISL